ncbi:MAG: hypothetical protein A3A86_06695 [Elusimicrobia bacterium RIFCSPLOWO2_01_FULL_60_11]|nr:MAG: hypothetical protein A3A86_06695 [Elusimicrobia bacterium RIFCSPLOWO2_01_FULL_60_11]
MTIREIVRATQGILVIGDPRMNVGQGGNVSIDSRTLRKGDIFFAIKGQRTDGHAHLEDSIKKGASLCVVSQIPEDIVIQPSASPALVKVRDTKRSLGDVARSYREKYGAGVKRVGIAGSCGKTTVKEMISGILKMTAPTIASPGNFNNEIGCPLSIFGLEPAHAFGVFEIGASGRGEVRRLSDIVAPHVAVITNIRLEHTETFGTLADIAEGEAEILEALENGGTAVLPREDPFFDFMAGKIPGEKKAKVLSFGFSPEAHVSAKDISAWPGPVKFTLVHRDDAGKTLSETPCTLPVLGRFNVLNACTAAAAALSLGISPQKISSGLADFSLMPMRFEVIPLKNDIVLVNDAYNSNPGSVRSSVEAFAEAFSNRRLVAVLGDMLELGEISTREHEDLGRFLAGFPLTKIILYGAQSKFTHQGAKRALVDPKAVLHCADKESLLLSVEKAIQPGTAVLFKASRGIRLEETVQKVAAHYL